jgi:hypothetical protein
MLVGSLCVSLRGGVFVEVARDCVEFCRPSSLSFEGLSRSPNPPRLEKRKYNNKATYGEV